jgi:hypothetical protein
VDFSGTLYPFSAPEVTNRKSVSPVTKVVIAFIQISQDVEGFHWTAPIKLQQFGMGCDTVLLDPGWIHSNATSYQERKKFTTQQTEVNITSD